MDTRPFPPGNKGLEYLFSRFSDGFRSVIAIQVI